MLGQVVREQYHLLFQRAWSVWLAALLLGALNVFLFAFDRPWTASDGARNWGDWLLRGIGVIERGDLLAPWLYSGSVLNLGLLAGALASALLSRQFAIRVAPPGELAKGALGGLLMGVGAVLAFGCNIGGFFSATSALSLSGVAMMAGLGLGAFAGIRYLLWEVEHWPALSGGRSYTAGAAHGAGPGLQPWLGGALLAVLVVGLPWAYSRAGYVPQAGFLLFGVAFGVLFQRSRFCLVRAFREPFFTGEGDHTRAAALALTVSALGFAILKFTDLKDRGEWVFPGFWIGGLSGGLLFGIGMTLAGGCGAGSIWRAGEGHVKLWCAVAGFAVATSTARLALGSAGLLSKLGAAVFLPSVLGWGAAIGLVVALMATWYIAAAWNEQTRRLSAM
ncbi:MAG TPA: YeeE/YedE thiosulfate transporter family protein [Candidatus Binatia bacterium]|nr:YeeE/YedE thiosulfate transporter family protein [Candidatus Binatia bacterium]